MIIFESHKKSRIFSIVGYTNVELTKRRDSALRDNNEARAKIYDNTTCEEILALIGLWIKLGAGKFKGISIKDIFSTNIDVFSLGKIFLSDLNFLDAHLVTSKNRYFALFSCLRFDIKNSREKNPDGSYVDKFVHLREVLLQNRVRIYKFLDLEFTFRTMSK